MKWSIPRLINAFVRLDTYIKHIRWASMLAMLLVYLSSPARAQFMRIQLVVDEEVSISDVRTLETGQIPVNYGWFQISISDDYAGRFTIRAFENINLLVSVQAPDELVLDANNTIPFRLETAYMNAGDMDLRQTVPFRGNNASFPISNRGLLTDSMPGLQLPLEAAIIFYGSVYVGAVDPGVYSGEVVVTINY